MSIADVTFTSGLADELARDQSTIASLDSQISSGKQLQQPSDDPVAVVDTLAYERQLAYMSAAQTSAQTAASWLGLATQTANSVLNNYQSARTVLLQSLNTGGQNAQTYTALAQQLQGIFSTLVGLGNTQFGNTAIFAGTANVAAPYATNGTYSGNNQTFTIQVGPGAPVAVSVPGTALFGGGTSGVQSVFTTLQNAISDLQAGPSAASTAALSNDLNAFDANIGLAEQASATLGVGSQRVETVTAQLTAASAQISRVLANTEDVNVATASTALQADMAQYQAALYATAHSVPQSLAEFLK
jgi:flagellar hook-associated protein 3 FlgL